MDFRKVLDQTVRDLKREVNKSILKVPEIEQKVLDATSNEPWGPHGTVMGEIAQATRNHFEFQMIMTIIWKRLSDTGRNWRHVYKGLTVLEYLVAHGSEKVIDEIREHVYQISTLSDFQFMEANGKDEGVNVRRKSQTLLTLVNDKEKIREVRQKANENRDKYRGVSSSGGMYKPSSYKSMGEGYEGDRYEEDRYTQRRDDDRYSRDRDGDRYREEGRYGRGSDRSSRSGDLYGDVDDNQYSSRRGGDWSSDKSRSYEKDLDKPHDDTDHYASRVAGGRNNDLLEDNKNLALKASTAPLSYEKASQSADNHATRPSAASSTVKALSANDSDDFDDFNPRASSAPPQVDELLNQSATSVPVGTSTPALGLLNVLGDATDFFGESISGVTSAPSPVNSNPVQQLAGSLFVEDPFTVEPSDFLSTTTAQSAIKPPPSYIHPAGNGSQATVQSSSTPFFWPPASNTNLPTSTRVIPPVPNAFVSTPQSQPANVSYGANDLFGFDSLDVLGVPASDAPQSALSSNTETRTQPAIPGVLQANQLPNLSSSQSFFSSTSQGQQPLSSTTYAKAQQEKQFETKSAVWADGFSKGLIDLNIGGPKSNSLAGIGIDFDLLRTERVKDERVSSGKSMSAGMGKAMGSGSGLGVAGASGIVPPAAGMMNNIRMPPNMGMGQGFELGAGIGTVPSMMPMGMNPGLAMRPPGMSMNLGMRGFPNQQQQY